MLLIADSGSTKTAWSLVNPETGMVKAFQTSGINPMYQDEAGIVAVLKNEFTADVPDEVKIYFYGAGCINNGVNATVRNALNSFFSISEISVETDLMAAARSLCSENEGIACILGTGSNSCYYNGHEITKNVSPLGFMLGDEGSGAVIGRKFVSDLLKNQLSEPVAAGFFTMFPIKPAEIMDHVYRKSFPNRYLAQFTRFIHDNLDEPALRTMVKNSFIEFFTRNISQYDEARRLPINFTGGIAFHFEVILRDAADTLGYRIGKITENPMEGLIRYHLHL